MLKLAAERDAALQQLAALAREYRATTAEASRNLQSAHGMIRFLQRRIVALETSTSWHVTAPLRWGARIARGRPHEALFGIKVALGRTFRRRVTDGHTDSHQ